MNSDSAIIIEGNLSQVEEKVYDMATGRAPLSLLRDHRYDFNKATLAVAANVKVHHVSHNGELFKPDQLILSHIKSSYIAEVDYCIENRGLSRWWDTYRGLAASIVLEPVREEYYLCQLASHYQMRTYNPAALLAMLGDLASMSSLRGADIDNIWDKLIDAEFRHD